MFKKKELNALKDRLNESIIKGEDYATIYKLSTDIDKLIAQFYVNNSQKV